MHFSLMSAWRLLVGENRPFEARRQRVIGMWSITRSIISSAPAMEFLVRFKDNEEVWLTFCPDVTATIQFEDFCRAHAELQFLLITLESQRKRLTTLNAQPITSVTPGSPVFVNLRNWGQEWYTTLPFSYLPSSPYLTLFLACMVNLSLQSI